MLRQIGTRAMMRLDIRHFSTFRPLAHQSTEQAIEKTSNNTSFNESHCVEVTDVAQRWAPKLKEAGIGDYDFNIKCLVAHVLKQKFSTIPDYRNLHFNATQLAKFEELCEARCGRMPLQHIIGEWDFMDLTLKTAPTVFIPRPETEVFVQLVIDSYREKIEPTSMLEVGCGSGAMSLAILNALPHFTSIAVERSKTATKLAWENAKMLKMQDRFMVYNHCTTKDNLLPSDLQELQFDLIISNPPYVKTNEFQYLQPEVVVYENLNALDGGPDGLSIARTVIELAAVYLRKGGRLWMELGRDHPPLVQTIVNTCYEDRLKFNASYEDQYGVERLVEIQKL